MYLGDRTEAMLLAPKGWLNHETSAINVGKYGCNSNKCILCKLFMNDFCKNCFVLQFTNLYNLQIKQFKDDLFLECIYESLT